MPENKNNSLTDLFQQDLQVVNVGLASFAETIPQAGGSAVHTEWKPPARGDQVVGRELAELILQPQVEQANQIALERLLAAQPVLQGVEPARTVIPNMGERTILHAGPPIAWEAMCGPMQGAIIGAILYEGWASDVSRARGLAPSGEIDFEPCHEHAAVGPMSGIISPSMPVWIVSNQTHGNTAFSNLNEGLGKVLRFGANDAGCDRASQVDGDGSGTHRESRAGQAGRSGDQAAHRASAAHGRRMPQPQRCRLVAAVQETGPRAAPDRLCDIRHRRGARVHRQQRSLFPEHFDGHLQGHARRGSRRRRASSLVTAMARNGVEFGIRVSGTGETWFTAPAPVVDGLYFPGYSAEDAAPDLGDSAIAETMGIGGFAMAASPAIVQFVGGTPQDALAYTREMTHITLGRNNAYTIPMLDFAGTPTGIDVRQVVDTDIAPIINTGIAHRKAGIGQVGAGITRAPLACFEQAVSALAKQLNEDRA